jgi:hypothetical protein
MRLEELCPQDRAACERAQEHNRADDFDTQAFNRSVRLIGRLHGPTPLAADNRDPTTYLWAACWPLEFAPGKPMGGIYETGEAFPENW